MNSFFSKVAHFFASMLGGHNNAALHFIQTASALVPAVGIAFPDKSAVLGEIGGALSAAADAVQSGAQASSLTGVVSTLAAAGEKIASEFGANPTQEVKGILAAITGAVAILEHAA